MRKVKTWSTHTGAAQFHHEAGDAIGYIPRVASIPSPYMYSPSDAVYQWRGMRVIFREVAHRRYQAFELPADMPITDDERATEAYLKLKS